ncbi:MAG: helix-turn-helix domain-containing protein [Bacteroidia bacterium]
MTEISFEDNNRSKKLASALSKVKNELENKKQNLLIEKIKSTIIEFVYYSEGQEKMNFSEYLNKHLKYNYTYAANLFSKVNGYSIQNFLIRQKIERVKELLIYDHLTLTEITYKLNYSSVAHLSTQFKKTVGINPFRFLKMHNAKSSLLPDKVSKELPMPVIPAERKTEQQAEIMNENAITTGIIAAENVNSANAAEVRA